MKRRALNRALLARQLLLERVSRPVAETIEHLVGMQAQAPYPPYYGLHARLTDFRGDALSQLLRDRTVVRIALMRSTIHLVTARDCLRLRALLQPMLDRSAKGGYGIRLAGMDFPALARDTRALVEQQPRTFSELGELLAIKWPDRDQQALQHAARALVPLVQIPPRGLWGESGPSVHVCADHWLGAPLSSDMEVGDLIRRYLRAFGPASIMDMQAWSGMTRLRDVVATMRHELVTFRDERNVELFDVDDAPRPDPDTPAPARFLGEYDNILLAHADRSRMIADVDRQRIYSANGIVRATVLVDGFVAGQWRINREGERATLKIELFRKTGANDRAALEAEGLRLLAFAAHDSKRRDVRFVRRLM